MNTFTSSNQLKLTIMKKVIFSMFLSAALICGVSAMAQNTTKPVEKAKTTCTKTETKTGCAKTEGSTKCCKAAEVKKEKATKTTTTTVAPKVVKAKK
jgi:hypothetical protein